MTQKELGYIELEWTCKHCGTINPGMKRVCTNCGAPIGQDDKFELPDQQELISDKEKLAEAQKGPAIQCPYCNVLNPAGTINCIQCGGDIQAGLARQAGEVLGAHETQAVPDKPCPSCGRMVSPNAQRCPFCGGSLVEASKPALASTPVKKFPAWLIFAGIGVGLICIVSLIAMIVGGNRTHEVTARVASLDWKLSVDVLGRQPVQQSAWRQGVPAEAEGLSCQDKYKETSDSPAPNATEVCGTPYVVDQGSGAGKVVQDCVYEVYAEYCTYTVMDWVVVDTRVSQGNDNLPEWPTFNLQAGQKAGTRHEDFQVIFNADGETYSYSPADLTEYQQFEPNSQWVLAINSFGEIKDLSAK